MGKHWTQEERAYFRDKVLPLSKYASGAFNESSGKNFAELVPKMQADLNALGQARRVYSADNLFQHWYQKVRKGASTNTSSEAYAPSMPGNGGFPSLGLNSFALHYPGYGGMSDPGHYGSSSPAQGTASGEDSASGDIHLDQTFTGVSSQSASLRDEANGASNSLPVETATAPAASSSTEQLTNTITQTITLMQTTTVPAASSSTEHPSNANAQTTTSTHKDMTSSDMAPPVTQVTLGDEDNSSNSKKRILLPTGEADDSPFSQNATKKPKLTNPADLKLKKATVPELGSDEASPTPPASKKTKGRAIKAPAPKMKPFDEVREGDKKPRGGVKTTGTMRGGRGSMLPRSGGPVHGGGHQRNRHLDESPVSYEEVSDEYEDEDRSIYPEDEFRGDSRYYGQQEYGMVRGRQLRPIEQYQAYPHSGLPPRPPYENAYGGLQPRYRPNPSFMQHTDDRHGPNSYYAAHAVGPISRQMPPLNPNATSFGPNYQPNLAAEASRMSSVGPLNPMTSFPRSLSSQQPSGPTSDHQMIPSDTASYQIDAPDTTSRPASSHSNKPTEPEETRPRRGKIYVANNIETMVETCPCCHRGF